MLKNYCIEAIKCWLSQGCLQLDRETDQPDVHPEPDASQDYQGVAVEGVTERDLPDSLWSSTSRGTAQQVVQQGTTLSGSSDEEVCRDHQAPLEWHTQQL